MRGKVVFYLNGQRQEAGPEEAGMMLADYLRYRRGLAGTKIVCAEGDCGACTVLRLLPGKKGAPDSYLPINSCIATVAQMDGSSVVSVDALAEPGISVGEPRLSPVQKAMVQCHGSQCGFCTPGFVMALTGLVEKKRAVRADRISAQEAKNALTGNLCRCTGYQPILDAALSLRPAECIPLKSRYFSKAQEIDLRRTGKSAVALAHDEFSFYAPRTLKEASVHLKKYPDARVLSAGTDLGVLHNKRRARLKRVLSLHLVPGLREIRTRGASRIWVGALVSLSELRAFTRKRVPELARYLDVFASPQIKNVATLAGNVANASPIADTPPFLLAADACVHVSGPRGKRAIPIGEFFVGYRKTALKAGELIAAIEFDVPGKKETLALYKVSQRKDLDISAVSAAFRVEWKGRGRVGKPGRVRVAMGGVAATPLELPRTAAAIGAGEGVDRVVEVLQSEIAPISDLRGSAAFRRVVAENLVRRFFEEHVSKVDA